VAGSPRLILLDTHAWLWWTSTRSELSEAALEAIQASRAIGVCTVSCWEVGMLVERGRISLDRPLRTWVAQALAQQRVESIGLDAETALDAALLDGFPGDPADRFIYASAVRQAAPLVTKDRALRAYDPQLTIW
jgi:PIN domain nuclease of toxin-antitoxin system